MTSSSVDVLAEEQPRIALVHDFLIDFRGGERVFKVLCDQFPTADVFSPIYDPKGTSSSFAERSVHTSYLNRLRPNSSTFRALLPFYPRAVESFDLASYDLIISSSSAWAHGVVAAEGQRHISYCHNPFRYAWDQREESTVGRGRVTSSAIRAVMARWRSWDRAVASEVDAYIGNGEITRGRIARCFGRSSTVLHPPVETSRFSTGTPSDRFVVLSELMPHKRIDVIVRACSELGLPLSVIGDGPDLGRLRGLAANNVEFTGRVSDNEVAERLQTAAALIQCATEEFGIASVEAQAAGRPVLALARGGALETVQAGESGEFFGAPEVESLKQALRTFDPGTYDPAACVASAERFSVAAFNNGIKTTVEAVKNMPAAPRERCRERRRGLWRAPLS